MDHMSRVWALLRGSREGEGGRDRGLVAQQIHTALGEVKTEREVKKKRGGKARRIERKRKRGCAIEECQ